MMTVSCRGGYCPVYPTELAPTWFINKIVSLIKKYPTILCHLLGLAAKMKRKFN